MRWGSAIKLTAILLGHTTAMMKLCVFLILLVPLFLPSLTAPTSSLVVLPFFVCYYWSFRVRFVCVSDRFAQKRRQTNRRAQTSRAEEPENGREREERNQSPFDVVGCFDVARA